MQWLLFAFGAYLLGSIPFGKLIARKVARIDITKKGSGNIGATNVARTMGTSRSAVKLRKVKSLDRNWFVGKIS